MASIKVPSLRYWYCYIVEFKLLVEHTLNSIQTKWDLFSYTEINVYVCIERVLVIGRKLWPDQYWENETNLAIFIYFFGFLKRIYVQWSKNFAITQGNMILFRWYEGVRVIEFLLYFHGFSIYQKIYTPRQFVYLILTMYRFTAGLKRASFCLHINFLRGSPF